jgi:hypothetical protein
LEVVFPLVAVEDLTWTSSDEEIGRHLEKLELRVSEALGISLLEVHTLYFRDHDESNSKDLDGKCERKHWLEEWAEENQVEHPSYQEDTDM